MGDGKSHATSSDLRREAGLAARDRSRALRAAGPRDRTAYARRAVRGPPADGPRLADARRPDLPYPRRRGASGGRPQRVESRQPARAVLGVAHAPAPPGPSHDVQPALVVPAVSQADADDDWRQRPVRTRRGRSRLPRSARDAVRPVCPQAAQWRGVRPLLSQQPRARGGAVSPHRVRRARRAQRVPGHRAHAGRTLLRQAEPGTHRRLRRVLRRDRRAVRDLRVPPRRSLGGGVGTRRRRCAGHVPSARRRDLAAGARALGRLDPAGDVRLSRGPWAQERVVSVELIREYWAYHHWANRRLFDVVATLGDDAAGREVGTQFSESDPRAVAVDGDGADRFWLET